MLPVSAVRQDSGDERAMKKAARKGGFFHHGEAA
jgi:hypothetical protein